MYNAKWDRWFIRSLVQNFQSDIYTYLEADLDKRDTTKKWIELRYDGPDIKRLSKSSYQAKIEVDIFLSVPVEEDLFELEDLKGKVKALFICFEVLDDDNNVLCSMEPSDLDVIDYGRLNEARMCASIRSTYTGSF